MKICHNHFPSCHRFGRGAQFLSDTFSSTSLCPSYPLGIMGVSVHSPHQWIPLTPRDPRQATPATATQSRTPTSWIREFVTLQWHLTMLWASVGRDQCPLQTSSCFHRMYTDQFHWALFKWVFIAPVAPLYVFNWPILSDTTAWTSVHVFPQKCTEEGKREKVNQTWLFWGVFFFFKSLGCCMWTFVIHLVFIASGTFQK